MATSEALRSDLRSGRPGTRTVRSAVAAGAIVRLVAAPWFATSIDVQTWWQASSQAYYGEPLYRFPGFSYPPAWGEFLQLLGFLIRLLGFGASSMGVETTASLIAHERLALLGYIITTPLFNFAVKLPLFVSDAIVALLVYRLVRLLGGSDRLAIYASLVWWLNPIGIFESAIHGAFDSLVALSIIASLYWALRMRPSAAGVAIGIGVALKLTPLLLVPVIAAWFVSDRRSNDWRIPVRRLLEFGVSCLVVLLVSLVPVLSAKELPQMLHDVFVRGNTTAATGGLSIYGVQYLRPLSQLGGVLALHGALLSRLAVVIPSGLALMCATGILLAPNRQARRSLLIVSGVSIFTVVFLISPLTQPQYVVWIFPLYLVAGAIFSGWPIRAGGLLLSLGVPLFEVGILGPLALAIPLVHAVAPSAVGSILPSVLRFLTFNQVFGESVSAVMLEFSWIVCLVAFGLILYGAISDYVYDAVIPTCADEVARGNTPRRVSRYLLLCLALCVPLGDVWVGLDYKAPTVSASLSRPAANVSVLTVKGRSTSVYDVLAYGSTGALSEPKKWYVYSGYGFPMAGSSPAAVIGLYDHLNADGVSTGGLVSIGLHGLIDVLSALQYARGRVLVVGTGTLPVALESNGASGLNRWIRHGGTLVWAGGAPPGYYYVGRGTSMFGRVPPTSFSFGDICGTAQVPELSSTVRVAGLSGIGKVVGKRLSFVSSNCWFATSNRGSVVSRGLGLSYRVIHVGPTLASLRAVHGMALGYNGWGTSSISTWPVGAGRVVLFGGSVFPTVVSNDVTKIFESGILNKGAAAAGDSSGQVYEGHCANVSTCEISVGRPAKYGVFVFVSSPLPGDPFIWRDYLRRYERDPSVVGQG